MPLIILFGLLFAAVAAYYVYKRVIAARLDKLYLQPFSNAWVALLQKNVSLYSRLPPSLINELHGCIQLFLNEKHFIGKGIEISDEIRLTIAGNACILLLQSQIRTFPNFKTIIVYPDTYAAKQISHDGNIQVLEDSRRAGESWFRGPIVLSWGDTLRGSINSKDGHNVVIHEFTHKLDEQSGNMDGLPVLRENAHYPEWASVLNEEFTSLKYRAERGKNSVMDKYGAVSASEFFAVATESFFEKSAQMKNKLPDLYEQLSRFYHLDPASWNSTKDD